jgi:hypothetical protein
MGFLSRFGRPAEPSGFKSIVRSEVKQNFAIKVPKDKAEAVQHGLEGWLESKGWAAVVNAKAEGDFVTLSFEHDETKPGGPPEIDAGAMSEELQKVLEDALKQQS